MDRRAAVVSDADVSTYLSHARLPVGSVVVNPRSDRLRKIVVEAGDAAGARRAMADMIDGDDTGCVVATGYGEIRLH